MCGWDRLEMARRFTLQALVKLGRRDEQGRQDLEGDHAIQAGIAARYTSPMPPRRSVQDLVGSQAFTRG